MQANPHTNGHPAIPDPTYNQQERETDGAPCSVSDLKRPTNAEIAAELGSAVARFAERLLEEAKLEPTQKPKDRLLRPDRAAETLGVSRQYFYDHEKKLPFVVRIHNGVLRVSEQGMLSWITRQRGAGSPELRAEAAKAKTAKGITAQPGPKKPTPEMPVPPPRAPKIPAPGGVMPDWVER